MRLQSVLTSIDPPVELSRNDWSRTSEASEAPTARLYRVQKEDDLSSIAVQFYGLPDFWVFIYSANAEEISRSGGVRPGQVLYIPDL